MFSKLFRHKKLKAVEFNAVMPDGSTKKTRFALGLVHVVRWLPN